MTVSGPSVSSGTLTAPGEALIVVLGGGQDLDQVGVFCYQAPDVVSVQGGDHRLSLPDSGGGGHDPAGHGRAMARAGQAGLLAAWSNWVIVEPGELFT